MRFVKQSVIRFGVCFSLCLASLCSFVVCANADDWNIYDSNYSQYVSPISPGDAQGISLRVVRGDFDIGSVTAPPSGRLASIGYYSGYNLIVPSASSNVLAAWYINYTDSNGQPVNEDYSTPFVINSWQPRIISSIFAPADHDRTLYFNLLVDKYFSFTSAFPTTVNFFKGSVHGTIADGATFVSSSGPSSPTTASDIILRFSVVVPKDATQVYFMLPGVLSRTSQTLHHYYANGQESTVGSITNGTLSGDIGTNVNVSTTQDWRSVRWWFSPVYDSNGKLTSSSQLYAQYNNGNLIPGTVSGTISGTITNGSFGATVGSTTRVYDSISRNQAICIYSGGSYIFDSGVSVQEQEYIVQSASTEQAITSIETTEHNYQTDALTAVDNIHLDTYSFSSGMISGIAVVGTVFSGVWSAIGDVKDYYLFVLIMGLALVIIGRVSRAIKEE